MSSAGNSQCPDPEIILRKLKDFQRNTVKYVFQRMYLDQPPALSFLVADEAGLGKTLVARGLIAKVVAHLWETVERIDVLYICSNTDIARQNISRLNIKADTAGGLTSRITLLPITLGNLLERKFNLVAFTPGTSFDLRSSGGIAKERALLYHLLRNHWDFGSRAGPQKVLQGWVQDYQKWAHRLRKFPWQEINESLANRFREQLDVNDEQCKSKGRASTYERFMSLADVLSRRNTSPGRLSDELTTERDTLVGELRSLLAKTCVDALEPDLIILDEFQRFRYLLDGSNPLGELAKDLFDFQDQEGNQARVLLLSATPYKMYTREHERQDNHFEDFLQIVKFLQADDTRTQVFEKKLTTYRKALYRLRPDSMADLRRAKTGAEADLRKIMVRTERLQIGQTVDSMVREFSGVGTNLKSGDLSAFNMLDVLTNQVGAHDHLEYWKSASYLPNFMEDYVLKRNLKKVLQDRKQSRRLAVALRPYREHMLSWDFLESYQEIDPRNAKLRTLIEENVDNGGWKLLWLPPSLPYYKPSGVFAEGGVNNLTKSLVFSCWQVVPKMISTLVSYDVERRMVLSLEARSRYSELQLKRKPLLRFAAVDGRLTGMPVLTLLYPSATLASALDPVLLAAQIKAEGKSPTAEEVLDAATEKVEGLLNRLPPPSKSGTGIADERWYWAAVSFLDHSQHPRSTTKWLGSEDPELRWSSMVRGGDESDTLFGEHVKRFRESLNALELGRQPPDLARVVALIGLASPAVCALRALMRLWPDQRVIEALEARAAAARIAMGFRSLFNLPATICLIRGLDSREPYWQRVLEYALDGNIQACLDEYMHVLLEWLGIVDVPMPEAALKLGDNVQSALSIRTGRLDFDELAFNESMTTLSLVRRAVRSRFAMRFGEGKNYEDEEVTREDQVRKAFNSPFRPFVLATTSVGQEGLDFHLYCHRVYHWDLPSNPVDLEQREGRVHRYKGHAIRRNIARKFGHLISRMPSDKVFGDPWRILFELALRRPDRPIGASELDPFWVFEIENGAFIERRIPVLPMSRDSRFLEELKSSLAAYRMVFGQPRQEDLLAFLSENLTPEVGLDDLLKLRIDLSPPQ